MLDKDRVVCVCNNISVHEMVQVIKENSIKTLDEVFSQNICPVGDKCESCQEEGYENDGFSLAMIFSLVKQQRL